MCMMSSREDGRTVHHLKIEKQWADARLTGDLDLEFRKNDRGFQKGDVIRYTVIDPKTKEPVEHTLNGALLMITYVLTGLPGMENGYSALSVKPFMVSRDAQRPLQ